MLKLITDRKSSDISRAKSLVEKAKKIENLTPEELEEYMSGLKGCYNISDLNRVEEAVKYISDLFNSLSYKNIVITKTWKQGDFFTIDEELPRYLENIRILRDIINVSPNTQQVPDSDKPYNKANDIEKILYDLLSHIENMKKMFVYSGVARAGQNRIWQQRFRRPTSEIAVYTLTNLIPDSSFEKNKWNDAVYSETEKHFGNRSLYFATGTTIVANIEIPRPIVGHKYYGRRYIKSNGDNQPADSRFEVWGGDGENKNWVYAWNNGNHPEWEFNSSIHEIKGVDYADRTIIRCFNVGTTADTWVDGLMLIDLTKCFGAGKEPNVFWCDRNIPYFEGTKTIEVKKPIGLNYKVFGNAEQATREGKNLLIKNGLSTPLTDSAFWQNASATTVLEDGWCRIELDNTSGTGEKYANQFTKIDTIDNIVANETYSIYYEIRNITSTNGNFYLNLLGDETATIWAGSIRVAGFNNKEGKYLYTRKTKTDLTGRTMSMRNFIAVSAGNKVTLEYRMMIVKGSYTLDTIGEYEPYGVMPSPNYPSIVYGLGRNGAIEFKQSIANNYIELVKTIDFTNHEPLMKVGDVEDYVDYENSRIVRNVGKYVFNGTENLWQDRELTNSFRYYTGGIIKTLSVDKKALCSHFVQSTTTDEINGIDKEKFALFNNTQIVLRINKTIATTISELQSYLASQYSNGKPVTVYYPLAEPYYEEIDLPSIQKIPGEYSLTAYDEYLDGRVEKE